MLPWRLLPVPGSGWETELGHSKPKKSPPPAAWEGGRAAMKEGGGDGTQQLVGGGWVRLFVNVGQVEFLWKSQDRCCMVWERGSGLPVGENCT